MLARMAHSCSQRPAGHGTQPLMAWPAVDQSTPGIGISLLAQTTLRRLLAATSSPRRLTRRAREAGRLAGGSSRSSWVDSPMQTWLRLAFVGLLEPVVNHIAVWHQGVWAKRSDLSYPDVFADHRIQRLLSTAEQDQQ